MARANRRIAKELEKFLAESEGLELNPVSEDEWLVIKFHQQINVLIYLNLMFELCRQLYGTFSKGM